MSKELSRPINVRVAADENLSIEVALELDDFTELKDMLVDEPEDADFSVNLQAGFSINSSMQSELSLELNGFFNVQCQRCMGRLRIPVDRVSNYLVLGTDKDAEQIPDSDKEILILARQDSSKSLRKWELDLKALVEEELVLNVPFYPRHENEQDCESADWKEYDAELIGHDAPETDTEDKQRPFAGLQDLIKKH